jgi:hypothetical protein
VALGTGNPGPEDQNLRDLTELFHHFDLLHQDLVEKMPTAPEVRIAAHKDVQFLVISGIIEELKKRRSQIGEYSVEVRTRK